MSSLLAHSQALLRQPRSNKLTMAKPSSSQILAVNKHIVLWCDICMCIRLLLLIACSDVGILEATAFIIGFRIALPAACLSICIHLERLVSFSPTSTTQAKRRRIVFEYSMSFGLPLAYIALRRFLSEPFGSALSEMYTRPDCPTSSIRSILWLWLSPCYVSLLPPYFLS